MSITFNSKISNFCAANSDLHYICGQKRHVWRESNDYNSSKDRPVLTVTINNKGDVDVRGSLWAEFELTKQEQKAIKEEWTYYQKSLPKLYAVEKEIDLPAYGSEHEIFKNPDNCILLKNHRGHIFGVEKRIETKTGKICPKLFHYERTSGKGDCFWSYEWPSPMPFHYAGKTNQNPIFYVFEGPRKAEYAHKIVTREIHHPWYDEMTADGLIEPCCIAIAGTQTIEGMDFSFIDKLDHHITYFADGDTAGLEAYQIFARKINKARLSLVRPDNYFKCGWDIVDEVPMKDGKPIPLKDILHRFANWCTTQTGDKTYDLTPVAVNELFYVGGIDVFGKKSESNRLMHYDSFNRDMRVQSHANAKIADLVMGNFACKFDDLAFDPTEKNMFQRDGYSMLNTYKPSNLKPKEGDTKLWIEFMEQLIPDDDERMHLLRWIATLYGKPEIRMIWAPLLISKMTGTGKGTLKNICAKLVGLHNTSFPKDAAIMAEFNGWLAQKRLVCVDEVYQGASWKMFNLLKELITEPRVNLRLMRKDPIEMDNWAHFFLMSNSFEALRIDQEDRRIFVPTVTEIRWPIEKWTAFHDWLNNQDGFSIIAKWALSYGNYVKAGEHAPPTIAKKLMSNSTENPVKVAAQDFLAFLKKNDVVCVLGASELLEVLSSEELGEKASYIKETDIRAIARKLGWIDATTHTDFKGLIPDWRNTLANKKMGLDRQYPLIHPELKDEVLNRLASGRKGKDLFEGVYLSLEQAKLSAESKEAVAEMVAEVQTHLKTSMNITLH